MCLLKNKKLYKVIWKYDSTSNTSYTEIVKAYDIADAWKIIKKSCVIAISLVNIEELK